MPAAEDPKQGVEAPFDLLSADYDVSGVDFFQVFGCRLVEIAGLRPGLRVLGGGTAAAPSRRSTDSSDGCKRSAESFNRRTSAHTGRAGLTRFKQTQWPTYALDERGRLEVSR
ncbi:MAG: hypothetical protein HYV62_11850 [Candidatus Rokubacteria bacterium]|nr:hypothetical protein [Candidatus Rokubacteria bacterium]